VPRPPGGARTFSHGGDELANVDTRALAARPAAEPLTVPRRRRGLTAGIVILLLLGGGAAAYLYRSRIPLRLPGKHAPSAPAALAPVALAQVVQGPLTSQQQVSGTVQYISDYPYAPGATGYPVVDQGQGAITSLPALGQVVSQGEPLYGLGDEPVLLLYGTVPDYRDLAVGLHGRDVEQLNAALVALGCATAAELPPASTAFTDATAAAVERLQRHAGLPVTGQIPLGEVLFLPAAVRVESVQPTLGASVAPGQTVLQTTSSTEEVVAQVDPSQASLLKAGDPATITFADGTTAPGKISNVAKVATSGGGGNSAPTVEIDIAPTNPSTLRTLDNASVQVSIIIASVPDALAVPVTALLAQAAGGYGLEVVGAAGTHTVVPVQLGIFDDSAGVVQVTGQGLAAGQRVVVAGT